jgi:hypothetical protein
MAAHALASRLVQTAETELDHDFTAPQPRLDQSHT